MPHRYRHIADLLQPPMHLLSVYKVDIRVQSIFCLDGTCSLAPVLVEPTYICVYTNLRQTLDV